MMGEPLGRQDRLFYEFDLEDMVPGDHLLRRIAAALDLNWLRGEMKTHYMGATWDQFDLERGVWTKPAHTTKQKRTEHIPLSGQAVALLQEIRTAANGKSPYVFPGTHVAKTRNGYGKKASYERIGVAWDNEDGSFYVKLYGTQLVSNFTLYAIEGTEKAGE